MIIEEDFRFYLFEVTIDRCMIDFFFLRVDIDLISEGKQ